MRNLRMSLTWVKEKGKDWKAIQGHASAPWVMQQEGEIWPIEELKARNQELEKIVAEKTAALTIEKEKTENLLYNILPVEVAKELLETGSVKPARFDEVSVLFSDFKEFTNIVATIPTRKLISELSSWQLPSCLTQNQSQFPNWLQTFILFKFRHKISFRYPQIKNIDL